MCSTQFAENTGRKKLPKIRRLELRHVLIIGKKVVKQ